MARVRETGMNGAAPRAVVLGAEESVRDLLQDVLEDVGVTLQQEGDQQASSLVVLFSERGRSLSDDIRLARAHHPSAAVVVLLPFSDDLLAEAARQSGAWACFSLWESLDALRRIFREALVAGNPARVLAGRP